MQARNGRQNSEWYFNQIFKNSKEISENIQNETSKIMDGLLIDKYRENYENTLTNLQELTNAMILRAMLHRTSVDLGGKYYPTVQAINELENIISNTCGERELSLLFISSYPSEYFNLRGEYKINSSLSLIKCASFKFVLLLKL